MSVIIDRLPCGAWQNTSYKYTDIVYHNLPLRETPAGTKNAKRQIPRFSLLFATVVLLVKEGPSWYNKAVKIRPPAGQGRKNQGGTLYAGYHSAE